MIHGILLLSLGLYVGYKAAKILYEDDRKHR
jgi:hypothetical protein